MNHEWTEHVETTTAHDEKAGVRYIHTTTTVYVSCSHFWASPRHVLIDGEQRSPLALRALFERLKSRHPVPMDSADDAGGVDVLAPGNPPVAAEHVLRKR